MAERDGNVRLSVLRQGKTKSLQLTIGADGIGYQILGPPLCGDSTLLACKVLDARDAEAIGRYLDKVPKRNTED